MCALIGERHGRDVWSNRREERGMGEMFGPIGRGMGEMFVPIRKGVSRQPSKCCFLYS